MVVWMYAIDNMNADCMEGVSGVTKDVLKLSTNNKIATNNY